MASSIQREMNSFFSKVQQSDFNIHAVTKGALTQARAKLKPEAFLELMNIAVRDFYEGAPYLIWKTHRILAIDGSSLTLPSHPSTAKAFGEYGVGCKAEVMRSMAHTSICYDVLNLITLDAKIDRFDVSEKVLLKEHLDTVPFKEDDLLLLDRGYPSIALMYELRQMGLQFCIRMKDTWWKEVRKLTEEGVASKEVVFELPPKDKHLMEKWNSMQSGVKCRLVRVELENGQHEILCTSLLDQKQYSLEEMKELYHCRWGVEEAYKLFKSRLQIESFSGKTAHAVKQDFYAKIFMMTTCAALSFPIEQKVRQEYETEKRKYPHQINRTNALAFCRDAWVALWRNNKTKKILVSLDETLLKTTDIVRAGRSFKRKKTQKKQKAMTYKQL